MAAACAVDCPGLALRQRHLRACAACLASPGGVPRDGPVAFPVPASSQPQEFFFLIRGLRTQLALFYLAVSLPALLLIEQVVLTLKYQRCLAQLDDGRVERALDLEAKAFAAALASGAGDRELQQRLHRFVLQLERPRQSLGTNAAYVLLELADHPYTVQLLRGGQPWLTAGGPGRSQDAHRRDWRQPLVGSDSLVLQILLHAPAPWSHFGRRFSFEWPMAFAYTLLFLFATALFLRRRVLRRIERIGNTAEAWAHGDFAPALGDPQRDELGALARRLDRMAQELQTLVQARSQLASLEERRRLARDLHDTVKQKVFALSLQLAAARQDPEPEHRQSCLDEAGSLVAEVQRELADLLRELREDAGATEDLAPTLHRRLQDFARRSGIAVDAELPERFVLPPTHAETLLRIVDEALANAWRHSGARRLQLSLGAEAGEGSLTIADDGGGGAREKPGGMGLVNLRLRAASLPQGQIAIDSPVAGGTRLQLRFSLPDETEA